MGTTRPTPPGVTEIFTEYVRQRQKGGTQDQAAEFIKPFLEQLGPDARHQLGALIRSWEVREGAKYKPLPQESAIQRAEELIAPPAEDEDLSWLPPPPQAPAKPVHPSIARAPDSQTAAAPAVGAFTCPSCGQPAQFGDAYCAKCGAMLNVVGGTTRDLDPVEDKLYESGSYFGVNSTLFIHVRGGQQPLQVRMSKPEMIVGRDAPDSLTVPDIDLSTYNGKEMGVSRIHARLRFQDNTLTLTDLGSINHTFVNGQRLHAHEVRVLRDGDEIRLGRLVLRIAFQHELRRLR